MNNFSICIIDDDKDFVGAFAGAVALGHPGYSVMGRRICAGECPEDVDVCICFDICGKGGRCEKSFAPACGKYAGVSAILAEARAFMLQQRESYVHSMAEIDGACAWQPFEQSSDALARGSADTKIHQSCHLSHTQ